MTNLQDIHGLYHEVVGEMREFRQVANAAWDEMMAFDARALNHEPAELVGRARPPRQNNYFASYAGPRQQPVPVPDQCQCRQRAPNCPRGPQGPPGDAGLPGLDGLPGMDGLPGESGLDTDGYGGELGLLWAETTHNNCGFFKLLIQ